MLGVLGASGGVGWLDGQAGRLPRASRRSCEAPEPAHRARTGRPSGRERDPGRRRTGVDARNERRPQTVGRSEDVERRADP